MHHIKSLFPQSLKNIYHLTQAIVANIWYGFSSRKIKVIGVTGTDGKTTTVQMITKILEEAGNPVKSGILSDHGARKVAMASTINFSINGEEKKNLSHYTTESSFAVQKFIKKAVESGCEYLVLETSSHSLDQHRVWGVQYDTAVITNITREHLDYHKTMERYREAKRKLFEIVSRNKGIVIVNLDMENPEYFLKFDADKKFGYTTNAGLDSGSAVRNDKGEPGMTKETQIIKADDIELGIKNTKFKVNNIDFTLNLIGKFNIENALAAICVGLAENISLEEMSKALEKIKRVPGRMEHIENDKGLDIIVDFALTPNALKKLYQLLHDIKKPQAKIIAVFGSCGERDRGKRPIMGEIVSKYADQIILTNDEPYHEEPTRIIEEIAQGIKNKKEGENFWKIPDRRDAILKALEMAEEGDIIAITGMGAEESMVVGDKKIPWNDRKVTEKLLQEMKLYQR